MLIGAILLFLLAMALLLWEICIFVLTIPSYFAGWKMYQKLNIPGWKYLIPYYSSYILFKKLREVKYFWITLPFSVVGSALMYISRIYRETYTNVYCVLVVCGIVVLPVSIVIRFFPIQETCMGV